MAKQTYRSSKNPAAHRSTGNQHGPHEDTSKSEERQGRRSSAGRAMRQPSKQVAEAITRQPLEQNGTPDQIMQLGLGFWGSKTLLSAVEIGLFTELASGPLTGEQIARR